MARLLTREHRRMTFIKAFMAPGDGAGADHWADVTIANISDFGMMLKCNEPPVIGATVCIRRRSACAVGTVQWVHGRRFGLRSPDRIDQDAFAAQSAAEAAQADRTVVPAPRLAERLWHWRAR